MDRVIDSGVEMLNAVGRMFCSHAWSIFVQVSILIAVLLALDLLLRPRVRAVVRYAMWMLVFVKLLLPPTLSLPTGIGYYRPEHKAVSPGQTEPVVEQPAPPAAVRPVRREPAVVLPPVVDVSHADVVPAPAAPAVFRPAIMWQGLVFLGWLAGVVTLSVYLLRRVQYVRKLIRRSTPASDALAVVLAQCAARLRLRSCPALRLSDDAPGPAVCGLFRPIVLMPTSLAENLSGERLRTVLVHELAHIRRADLWVNFAQTLLLVAYFYHPLLWLANAVVRRLREQAVDETVLVALDAEAESYGATLIDLAEMTFHRPALGLRLIGIAESRKALEGRIRHMITQPKPRTAKLGFAGLLAIALAAAALLPMARAKTQAQKPQFIVRLSNGVTAELLGVCNWPTQEAVCWKPDGSPLAPPLQAKKSHVGRADHRYGFILRVTGPDDLNISWNKIEGAGGWEGSCDVLTADGKRLGDCTAAVASMEAGIEKTSLRVGFATGPWITISTHDGKSMSTRGRAGVLWSHAFNDSGTACIVATAEWIKDRTTRIIAIDNGGATHTAPRGSVAQGNMDQMTARFYGLSPDRIREFQYQVRPYEWAEFEDVSLRPGEPTNVRVQTDSNEKTDYAHAVVEEGVGFDGIVVGETTAQFIKSRLGEPYEERNSQETGWWLDYGPRYGVDFWLKRQTGVLAEIRLNKGFEGRLRSGISKASTQQEVFQTYGQPRDVKTVMDLEKHFDNQILYRRLNVLGRLWDSKIFYRQRGLLFWFEGDKIKQIVIHAKESAQGEPSAEPAQEDKPDEGVVGDSHEQLSALGRALLIYANDHDDKLPETLAEVQDEIDQAGDLSLAWVRQNVAYLGRGMTTSNEPDDPVAYDKMLYERGGGTNVLHLDTSVAFESPERLEELGVAPDKPSPAALRDSARRLRALGRSLVIYAKDHDDTFPNTLDDLQSDRATDPAQRSMERQLAEIYGQRYPEQMDARQLAWCREHVQYLGKGVKATADPARVLAYDRTLLVEGKGTNALYLDATVEFVTPEEFQKLGIETARTSLPDIFILSPSRVGFNVFDAINSRTQDWTWNKTGRYHDKEAYDRIFNGTDHRTSHDILVLVFTLDSEGRIPAGYEDLLPMSWNRIEQTLRQGQTVEMAKEARGLHVILLAAPDSDQIKRLIAGSKLLADSKEVARSAVTGCDVAIEDFTVRADPDLGTFAAIVSIRNPGVATCPKIAVYFYRGDPEIATPMMHGAGPLEPGQTWNEVSSQFALREGANEVSVVLDPGNLVAEPDETNNRATLRIVIRDGQITEQSIVPATTSAPSPETRAESATRLSDLGKTLLIYANDHDDKLPDELTDVRRQYGVGFSWLYDNVAYLGKGMTVRDRPGRPIAYDKTLIQGGAGTNVLYLDCRVVFENPSRLEELGIRYEPKPKSAEELRQEAEIQARVTVLSHLKQVALAAHLYGGDNDGVFPDALEMLEPYLKREEGLWVWVRANVEYTGKGLNPANVREPSSKPIAYSRLASDQAAVAFVDGHVEYVIGPRLKELGIEIER